MEKMQIRVTKKDCSLPSDEWGGGGALQENVCVTDVRQCNHADWNGFRPEDESLSAHSRGVIHTQSS